MNDIDKMPSKCHDCPYWEACDYPYICPDVGRIQPSRENGNEIKRYSEDTISRQAAIDEIHEDADWLAAQGSDWQVERMERDKSILKSLPPVQPEIIRCKDCKHFHYDMPYVIQGIPVLGHEVCDFWGDGCKTSENGFCSFAEE